MQTATEFYLPRVIDNKYFIGSYASEPYYKYIYVVDMTDIDEEDKYDAYLEKVAGSDAQNVYDLSKTMIGTMSSGDVELYEAYFENKYPDFDLEGQE